MPGGRPTDYDPNFHPEDCIRLGRAGKFKVQMARDWDVCTQTIDNWCHEHPEFFAAYKKSANFRTAWMLDQAQVGMHQLKGESFNHISWSMMMRYDGQNTDERKVKLPDLTLYETATERANYILESFAHGEITPKETKIALEAILLTANIEEATDIKSKFEALRAHFGGKK